MKKKVNVVVIPFNIIKINKHLFSNYSVNVSFHL